MTFFFFRLQSSHWSTHFLETILKPIKAKSGPGKLANLVQMVPLSFLLFQGNILIRTCLKGPPSSFLIFCNGMHVNKSRRVPPLTFFGSKRLLREKIFKNFNFFSKIFRAFSALYIAPTVDVLVLLFEPETQNIILQRWWINWVQCCEFLNISLLLIKVRFNLDVKPIVHFAHWVCKWFSFYHSSTKALSNQFFLF